METRRVKDLMVPLGEYAVVPEDATLLDALVALEEAQKKLPPGRQPHRAVLIVNPQGNVVGKIGQLAFMKALEPKYSALGDLSMLSRAGITSDFISSMMEHYRFFEDDLPDLLRRARSTRASKVMHPVTESIDENATLGEAIHKIVIYQTLSILVTRGDEVVGLLRLSDLFDEISEDMRSLA